MFDYMVIILFFFNYRFYTELLSQALKDYGFSDNVTLISNKCLVAVQAQLKFVFTEQFHCPI